MFYFMYVSNDGQRGAVVTPTSEVGSSNPDLMLESW